MTLPDATYPLSAEEADAAFAAILDGRADDAAVRDFLLTMSLRDETAVEIAAAVRAIRARMRPVSAPANAIDVCGTGGDMANSLNVSTAVALVVAACGVPVAKHGNRAASSQAGGADTLEALGLNLTRAAETAEATLVDLGIAFLFAQSHHPALVRLAPVRRSIQRRTIFNLTGPACNPAGVSRQLIGVARPDFLAVYADALTLLGHTDVMLVAGDEPLDELSIAGPSTFLRPGQAATRITPETAGLPRHPLTAIRGGDAAYNARALSALLDGLRSPYRDAVLLNAAAALLLAHAAANWHSAVHTAAHALDSGAAKTLLTRWLAY
ncbi:anthranilate phosphoribosyltransferase [Sandaracinobacteroides saxicola]|uniref:Anthranilate phosphoribosyltransferase n=1 Tax=Sandaracinobacteroides saxicola TaxID=2759707 RepID=A0A7G5IJW1_9SPHN|nr:anthranilate phosphoribosyltransferase [Sandaracinobacteroides saxicola]QMW23653.1 anthranilate phosphoribosyltransferase [Sandaracinobacteroides saxicola]